METTDEVVIKVNQPEAFCIMRYGCKKCHHGEKIWNSRDGVTPFIVPCAKCGGEASHIQWDADFRKIDHVPNVGDRIFISTSLERAREIAARRIEALRENYPPPKNDPGFAERIAMSFWKCGTAPDLVEVSQEMRVAFEDQFGPMSRSIVCDPAQPR